MKKIITILGMILTFFLLYFLQSNFFSWFTIGEIKPNLFIIFVLNIGLFAGRKTGTILGILFGMYIDIIIGKGIGVSAVMLGIVGFLGGYFDKNFSKDSKITIMFMIMGVTAIYEIGSYIFAVVKYQTILEVFLFVKMLCVEMIYNMLLSIILYPLLQKIGYKIEEIYKGNVVLTRYF